MKLSRSDVAVTLLVCLLSSFLILLFVRDLNAVLARGNEAELGSIVFRKHTATRKPAHSLQWERLRNHSTIYQGDTIRTADVSEAAVFFGDGTSLDVFENSMLRLDFSGQGQEYQLNGGAMHFGAADGSGTGGSGATRTVRVGKTVVDISGNSDVSLLDDGATLSVDVASGSASITSEAGGITSVGANQEFRMNVQSGETSVITRTISAVWPGQGMRLLNAAGRTDREGNPVPTDISFIAANSLSTPEGTTLFLELSTDSLFENIAQTVTVKAPDPKITLNAPVAPGVWFWRVRSDDGQVSSVRRFSLSQSGPPKPILPADGIALTYRNRLPSIRFSWGESEEAISYILELAKDRAGTDNFSRTRTNLTGLTVATLAEGTWYWRVVPVYPHTLIGKNETAAFRSITIVKSSVMQPLVPVRPADGTLFQIQDAAARGMSFSWQPESEAVGYELRILDRPDAAKPLSSFATDRPFMQLDSKQVPFLAKAGTWYWAVVWKDAEGNLSPLSKALRMVGVDGKIAIRQSFPPEGYTIADSLTSNTRFAWKSNITARTVFQLSADPLFADVAQETEVHSESILGSEWKAGVYYWRLRTYNIDGSVFVETPPRSVTVAKPLAEPVLLHPMPSTALTVVENEVVRFNWQPVPNADYYAFQAYFGPEAPIDTTGETEPPRPAFEATSLAEPSCDVPLGSMSDGLYRIHVQAFALDTMESTRIIGYVSKNNFNVKKIHPVELRTPGNGAKIEGLTARRQGIDLSWYSQDPPTSLTVSLLRNGSPYPLPFKNAQTLSSVHIERLPEGSYKWKIQAAIEQFNISSKEANGFTVLAIPQLTPSTLIEPADQTVYGPNELRASRAIRFTWTAVPGATHYTLKIFNSSTKALMYAHDKIDAVSYILEDLAVLDRGSFTWEITAQNYWSDGLIEQDGKEARSRFKIDLPDMKAPNKPKDKTYYGN